GLQQPLRLEQSHRGEVLDRGHAELPAEYPGEVKRAEERLGGQVGDGQPFVVTAAHGRYRSLDGFLHVRLPGPLPLRRGIVRPLPRAWCGAALCVASRPVNGPVTDRLRAAPGWVNPPAASIRRRG